MSRSPTSTAWHLVIAVHVLSAVLLTCTSAFAQDKTDSGEKIKDLKKERLALLVKIQRMTGEQHKMEPEHVSADQVRQSELDVFTARLDLAETKDDRIKICEEMVKDAVEWEKLVDKQIQGHQRAAYDALKAQAHLLATRIALEKTKASE